jgi:cyclopropane fatty-acyl-phospholipid synthase-like methyltransferase
MNLPLPPARIRQGGPALADDAYFLESGLTIVGLLRDEAGLEPTSSLLDFGCGPGRLSVALIASDWYQGSYVGVDVKQVHVDWCNDQIASRHPSYRFSKMDAANDRYNPSGLSTRQIPVDSESRDVVCAWSVFSHMGGEETFDYLREIRRILGPGGRAFVTVFVGDDVPPETENPSWYGSWSGRLHCVLYSTDRISQLITDAGLMLEKQVSLVDHPQTGLVLGQSTK